MKFFRLGRQTFTLLAAPNTCHLTGNSWDDFGFKTSFTAVLFDETGKRWDLGHVRIMTKEMKGGQVDVPEQFDQLDESYCSLGSDRKYYVSLSEISPSTRTSYLKAMRDCAADHSIWRRFQSDHAMQASLLRETSPRDVLTNYPQILTGDSNLKAYAFAFDFRTDEPSEVAQCYFSVGPNSKPPSNIHVLIGKNGVGKTRLLAGMADALTENKATSIGLAGSFTFTSQPGGFSEFLNLVVVSYSAFDRFDPLLDGSARTERSVPYYYVGIKNQPSLQSEGVLAAATIKSSKDLDDDFHKSISIVLSDPQRRERWIQSIRILSSDPGIKEINETQIMTDDVDTVSADAASAFSRMSSGHKVVLLTMTKLVEFVSDRSLVLIDEPETHLHPPLLGSFIRALSNLLAVRNGVAIIATHSPVVLQEVPSNCVSLLLRSGNSMRVVRPDVETFAENVSVLTRKVFGLEIDQSGFYKLLKDSSEGREFSDVVEQFGDRIGSEGRALTRAFTVEKK
jgi:predicted ATPase